jgi:nucleotide-binding universal stress UspA family protein
MSEASASPRSHGQNHIVVGVDGSAGSATALRWAARYAASIHAAIEVVTAWQPLRTYGWAYDTGGYQPDVAAEKAMTTQIDDVFGTQRPDTLTTTVQQGPAAPVLIEASRNADLLVVGSRGHGGFAGLLLGSVSANCAERATCPVVVVHASVEPADPS